MSLIALLRPERPTAVVDIGSNPIDGAPPYKPLLDLGLCTVVGFEPQAAALARLNAGKGASETYLPYVIGDGQPAVLRHCRAPGMTSLLRPDRTTLSVLNRFADFGAVVSEEPVQTRRLDDVAEVAALDFLKIDIQGGELAVFEHGQARLAGCVAIQTEASFLPLYEDQPPIGVIDTTLRRLGFIPHCFAELKCWPISPAVIGGEPTRPLRQLLEADLVYVRDFTRPEAMTAEQLKHLVLIAHHCYGSYDLALRLVTVLAQRGDIDADGADRYLAGLAGTRGPR